MELLKFLTPETVNGAVGIISGLIGGIGTYIVTSRKNNASQKRSVKSEFDLLLQANEKFRAEIRGDLSTARKQILALEDDIEVKNKEVEELKNSITDLKNELANKDKKISDMKVEIMRRDLQIEELKTMISVIGRQTSAVAEMQTLQQRQFSGSIEDNSDVK
jgi:chromosome segregation ATPase